MKLFSLKAGETAYITGYSENNDYVSRLMAMGLNIGDKISIKKINAHTAVLETSGKLYSVRSEAGAFLEVRRA